MAEKKLNLLNEELDEESQKYIQDALESWKESTTNQIMEQNEQVVQAKIAELEEADAAYREELKEEFAEKMLDGINELKESIRAEVTAEVIKNNPEIKILEQVKAAVAPLVSEDYRDNAYSDTIEKLSEENSALKRQMELDEGAKTLASLIAPYSENVQNLFISMVPDGNPDEVTESFMKIYDGISGIIEAEEAKDEFADDGEDDDEDEEGSEKKSKDDEEAEPEDGEDDSEDKDDKKKKEGESKDEPKKDEAVEESYIQEGMTGMEDEAKTSKKNYNSLKTIISEYANS